jgi:hypothetical protein
MDQASFGLRRFDPHMDVRDRLLALFVGAFNPGHIVARLLIDVRR